MNESMTSNELNKLIIWLKSKGFSGDDVVDCLAYMTGNEKAADTTNDAADMPEK